MAYPPPSWRFSPLPRKINHSTFPRISSASLKWLCEASWPYERFNLAALSGKLKAYLLGRIHASLPLSRRGNYHQHHRRRCCRILELFERWFRAIVPSSEQNLDVACPSAVFHENAVPVWSRAVNLEINTGEMERWSWGRMSCELFVVGWPQAYRRRLELCVYAGDEPRFEVDLRRWRHSSLFAVR